MSGGILARTLNRRGVKVEILEGRAVTRALDAADTPPKSQAAQRSGPHRL
jgi:hypothetical protein